MSGRGYRIGQRGELFYVIGADGQRVGVGHLLREGAEASVENLLRAEKRSMRVCISCGRAFASDGIHNRMCNECKRGSTG